MCVYVCMYICVCVTCHIDGPTFSQIVPLVIFGLVLIPQSASPFGVCDVCNWDTSETLQQAPLPGNRQHIHMSWRNFRHFTRHQWHWLGVAEKRIARYGRKKVCEVLALVVELSPRTSEEFARGPAFSPWKNGTKGWS